MLQDRLGLTERRACRITGQNRSTQRHHGPHLDRDDALRRRLREISREHPRRGYRKAWALLRGEGWEANRKRIQRLWREEGLRVPPRRRKRRRLGTSTIPAIRLRAEHPNHVWAFDFQFDTTSDGRILKLLHVVDAHTREALAVEVARRIDADATVAVLERIALQRGAPTLHPDGQRPRDDRPRDPRLVPGERRRHELHRAGLPEGEPVRGIPRQPGARRAAGRRGLRHPPRGSRA